MGRIEDRDLPGLRAARDGLILRTLRVAAFHTVGVTGSSPVLPTRKLFVTAAAGALRRCMVRGVGSDSCHGVITMNGQMYLEETRNLFERMKKETAAKVRQSSDDELLNLSRAVESFEFSMAVDFAMKVARAADKIRIDRLRKAGS